LPSQMPFGSKSGQKTYNFLCYFRIVHTIKKKKKRMHFVIVTCITLFRSITMFSETNNIVQNIPHIHSECAALQRVWNVHTLAWADLIA
jgi:adenosyl cobinamide kinase/adenosyl cobinamide phosphate guanylyltransferase